MTAEVAVAIAIMRSYSNTGDTTLFVSVFGPLSFLLTCSWVQALSCCRQRCGTLRNSSRFCPLNCGDTLRLNHTNCVWMLAAFIIPAFPEDAAALLKGVRVPQYNHFKLQVTRLILQMG